MAYLKCHRRNLRERTANSMCGFILFRSSQNLSANFKNSTLLPVRFSDATKITNLIRICGRDTLRDTLTAEWLMNTVSAAHLLPCGRRETGPSSLQVKNGFMTARAITSVSRLACPADR